MAIPKPSKATCPRLYKYSSHEHLERLRVIILEHELYLPTVNQLNDPADGLPKLAMQSEDEMVSFFYGQYIRLHPELTPAEQEEQAMIIRYNVKLHSPAALQPMVVQALDAELQEYRIYSLSKRYDNMNLWAQYAAQHRGYCLEFANEGPLFEHAKEVTYMHPVSCLSWKWKRRSSVKITERTHAKREKALHVRRESRHPEAALVGQGAGFRSM